jgi:hypothetical protein
MSQEYAYGRTEQVFVKKETYYGVLVYPAGTDAISVLKCDMGMKQERKDIREKGASRSLITRVTGRKTADWSIEKYLRPSGVAGTKPDDTDLWEALFGSVTTPNNTVLYALLAEPAVVGLSIFRNVGPHQEAICGAIPSKWGLKFGGGDEPKVTFSGQAKDHYLSGSDALAAEVTSSVYIYVADARRFAVGMKVKVGTETNTTGFLIDAIDYATNKITLHTAVTHQVAAAAVIPSPLTATTAGIVIPVIVGTVKFGNTTILITGCSFDVDQKVKLRNDEFGSSSASGYRHPDFRDVSCSLDLNFTSGAAAWLNDAKRFTPQDIEVILGDTAGSKVQIDASQVEFDIPKPSVPDTDETKITLSGKCLATSAGENELTVTFL